MSDVDFRGLTAAAVLRALPGRTSITHREYVKAIPRKGQPWSLADRRWRLSHPRGLRFVLTYEPEASE